MEKISFLVCPNNSGNIVNGDNTNSPLTAVGTEQPGDGMQKEIGSILSELTFRERTELMTMIYKFADEHKKTKMDCESMRDVIMRNMDAERRRYNIIVYWH